MKTIYCIICPKSCIIEVEKEGDEFVIKGNSCPRGRDFAINEMTNPVRTISSSVRTNSLEKPVLPVRVTKEIPKDMIFKVMEEINKVSVKAPVRVGDVLIPNVLGLGADVIATDDLS